MTSLIGQSANIVSMIFYGIFILIAIVILVIIGFGLYKFVMWLLYSISSKDKKKEIKQDHQIMKEAIEKEIEEGKRLENLAMINKQKGGGN